MIAHRAESAEVLYPLEPVVLLEEADLAELKMLALKNPRQRIRMCGHLNPEAGLHEMFIVHTSRAFVPPHKHVGKDESFSVLEGEVEVVHFSEEGVIERVVSLGTPVSGRPFYHRINGERFHSLVIQSEFLVFHEVTSGPFRRDQTVMSSWIDGATDEERLTELKRRVEAFKRREVVR